MYPVNNKLFCQVKNVSTEFIKLKKLSTKPTKWHANSLQLFSIYGLTHLYIQYVHMYELPDERIIKGTDVLGPRCSGGYL